MHWGNRCAPGSALGSRAREWPTWSIYTFAFYVAQQGGKHCDPKILIGFGSTGVVEIVTDHRGDMSRAVYTLHCEGAVYVLHAFQKKSKTGRETPKRDMELIRQRLREAEQMAKGRAR